MYNAAKSCIFVGAWQGENMSPLLVSLYLDDLQDHLLKAHMDLKEIRHLASDYILCVLIKLHISLQDTADDTV